MPLKQFITRLEELILEWPEHAVLVQIMQICHRILSFPVTSPLMKVLSGLEMLLKKAQEWESYASKKVSVQGDLFSINISESGRSYLLYHQMEKARIGLVSKYLANEGQELQIECSDGNYYFILFVISY